MNFHNYHIDINFRFLLFDFWIVDQIWIKADSAPMILFICIE